MAVQPPADLVPMSRARATLGVSSRTLRRDTASGKREDLRSPGGHRVLRMADLHVLNAEHEDKRNGVLIYARVSCAGQKDDLVRQIEDTGSDEHIADGDANAELVRDLLSVVTSCSGKLYGARANARRKALRAAVEKGLVA